VTRPKLTLRYDRRQRDFVVNWPAKSGGARADGRLVMHVLTDKDGGALLDGHSLVDELERRGYDPETVRFEIALSPEAAP
jgi:hypothetical protein